LLPGGRELIAGRVGREFVDSGGVAAVVAARGRARTAGGGLLLAAPQGQVLGVVAATGLAGVFAVCAGAGQVAGRAGCWPLVAGPVP
jgi:hypothetical protein